MLFRSDSQMDKGQSMIQKHGKKYLKGVGRMENVMEKVLYFMTMVDMHKEHGKITNDKGNLKFSIEMIR